MEMRKVKKIKKTQMALFSLISLIFMFGVVLLFVLKEDRFLNDYKFETEKKIKELCEDYIKNNYIYSKQEEVTDSLFISSFTFFPLSKYHFFSKKLVKEINVYDYYPIFNLRYPSYKGWVKLDDEKLKKEFTEYIEDSGLEFNNSKKIRICTTTYARLFSSSSKSECNTIINDNYVVYKTSCSRFWDYIFQSFYQLSFPTQEKEEKLRYEIVSNNFNRNIIGFLNENYNKKNFLNYSSVFNPSPKYGWILEVFSRDGEPKKELISPIEWLYTIEKDFLIICRRKYKIYIKNFFDFYNFDNDKIKTIDCLAFKIKNKEKLNEFLEKMDCLQSFPYNLNSYFNLNVFYIETYQEKNNKEEKLIKSYGNNEFEDISFLINEEICPNFEKKKYCFPLIGKKQLNKLLKETGIFKIFNIKNKGELILLSPKIGLTNLSIVSYNSDFNKKTNYGDYYIFVLKVKDSCSELPYSIFYYVKNQEGFKNLIKEKYQTNEKNDKNNKENLILNTKEKINLNSEIFYFYHFYDYKNNKELCILSKEGDLEKSMIG